MELNEHGFLEELLALRRDTWEAIPTEMNELFSNTELGLDYYFDQNPSTIFPNSCSSQEMISPQLEQSFNYNNNHHHNNYSFNEFYYPLSSELLAPQFTSTDSSYNTTTTTATTQLDTPTFNPIQEDFSLTRLEEEELGILGDEIHILETQASCKMEPVHSPEIPVFNMGLPLETKNRAKKLQGQPSKNLMAERRRRKRLNDRLSMLRSIVPKISKMDRTSILGDTIDYMKELLERINNLQQEIEASSTHVNEMSLFKDVKPNEVLVRNSPKFDVERRNVDTRIEICCAGKPGLLFSTVTTLEALGLEIEQCVISCFNDFAMQASCSEDLEKRALINSEDIKQALFRNAGYGGRCM
ncbi:Basic helix-loop-helix transcription factor [Parasponia andersonii]|uniref:Basic helix-loop-helix transcription factor n=1 Tax=Parasponia andersonii TaxID=3476 RepID=A0A2P5CF14_PARAD|nr:Basic helix-loop-helix transcription factor [Parasponia andersonii]